MQNLIRFYHGNQCFLMVQQENHYVQQLHLIWVQKYSFQMLQKTKLPSISTESPSFIQTLTWNTDMDKNSVNMAKPLNDPNLTHAFPCCRKTVMSYRAV